MNAEPIINCIATLKAASGKEFTLTKNVTCQHIGNKIRLSSPTLTKLDDEIVQANCIYYLFNAPFFYSLANLKKSDGNLVGVIDTNVMTKINGHDVSNESVALRYKEFRTAGLAKCIENRAKRNQIGEEPNGQYYFIFE